MVTFKYSDIEYSPAIEIIYCIDIGHFIIGCIDKVTCIVYFDAPINIHAVCRPTNFQLKDGRVVIVCKNRAGNSVFIDEYGETVPYNTIPMVGPNTYENDKMRIKHNGILFEYTNKSAGARTKAAIRAE